MGCRSSRGVAQEGKYLKDDIPCAGATSKGSGSSSSSCHVIEGPIDDVVTHAASYRDSYLAVSGTEGWVYFYSWQEKARLAGKFRAHLKAANRLVSVGNGFLLTASTDATVRLWAPTPTGGNDAGPPKMPHAVTTRAGSCDAAVPTQTFQGHRMSVSALEYLPHGATDEANCAEDSVGGYLFTGSRDCTVRLWDMETATELQQAKILRNVITAVRRVPNGVAASTVVQASEDLQLRLWDCKAGSLQAAMAVRSGPNQLICLDVTDDGLYAVCGSKGFSRENCEVKVFDIRGGLRELYSVPCADQTIEALRMVGANTCLIASKDGHVRGINLPEVSVKCERGPASGGYTTLGVCRRSGAGPVTIAAVASSEGPELEVCSWPHDDLSGEAKLLAVSSRV